jgi:hypothetical protein
LLLLLLLGLLLLLLPVLLLLLLTTGVGVATLHRLLVATTISAIGSTSPKSPAPGTTLVAVVLCLLVVSLVRVISLKAVLLISPILLLLLLLLSLATLVAGPALLLNSLGALVDLLYYEGLIAPFRQGGGSEDLNVMLTPPTSWLLFCWRCYCCCCWPPPGILMPTCWALRSLWALVAPPSR